MLAMIGDEVKEDVVASVEVDVNFTMDCILDP